MKFVTDRELKSKSAGIRRARAAEALESFERAAIRKNKRVNARLKPRTEQTLSATDAGQNLIVNKDADEMFGRLGIDSSRHASRSRTAGD